MTKPQKTFLQKALSSHTWTAPRWSGLIPAKRSCSMRSHSKAPQRSPLSHHLKNNTRVMLKYTHKVTKQKFCSRVFLKMIDTQRTCLRSSTLLLAPRSASNKSGVNTNIATWTLSPSSRKWDTRLTRRRCQRWSTTRSHVKYFHRTRT